MTREDRKEKVRNVGLGALGLWFAVEFIQTLLLVLVVNVANKPSVNDEHLKENKNPYSKKGEYERNLQKKCDNDI